MTHQLTEIQLQQIQGRLREAERAYLDNFCTSSLEWGLMVFQDKQLPDMFDHNCIRIPHDVPNSRLRQLADIARNTSKATGRPFLKLCLSQPLSYKSAVSGHEGYYMLPQDQAQQWQVRTDCRIVQMREKAQIQQLYQLEAGDSAGSELRPGDFDRRSVERRSLVYLDEEKPLNCWLCYVGEELAARADLQVTEGVAKIEELITAEKWRRQGLATALLRHLALEAGRQGADLIYLVADEEDTPKEMYLKLGFVKVMDDYFLRWMFNGK